MHSQNDSGSQLQAVLNVRGSVGKLGSYPACLNDPGADEPSDMYIYAAAKSEGKGIGCSHGSGCARIGSSKAVR